jgi:hypothetical protein
MSVTPDSSGSGDRSDKNPGQNRRFGLVIGELEIEEYNQLVQSEKERCDFNAASGGCTALYFEIVIQSQRVSSD